MDQTNNAESKMVEEATKRPFYPWLSIHRAFAVVFVVYYHFCQKMGTPLDQRIVTTGWPYVLPILATVSGFLHAGLTFRRAKRLFGLMMFGIGLNALAYVVIPSTHIVPNRWEMSIVFHMWFVPGLAAFMVFHTYQRLVGCVAIVACLVAGLVYEDPVFGWVALTWSLCLGAEQAGHNYPQFAPYRHWAIWLIANTGFAFFNTSEQTVWEIVLLYWYYASGAKLDLMTLQRQIRKSAPLLFVLYMFFGWAEPDRLLNGMIGMSEDVRIALGVQRVVIISVSMGVVPDTSVFWKRWMDPAVGMVYMAQVWPIVIARNLEIEKGDGMCLLLTLAYVALVALAGWGIDLRIRQRRPVPPVVETKGGEIVELGGDTML